MLSIHSSHKQLLMLCVKGDQQAPRRCCRQPLRRIQIASLPPLTLRPRRPFCCERKWHSRRCRLLGGLLGGFHGSQQKLAHDVCDASFLAAASLLHYPSPVTPQGSKKRR